MNEAIIAKEVKQAQSTMGIKRENVFIATKLPPKDQGYEKTKAAVERSLKALSDVQYIDLMLLTFPSTPGLDPKDQ
jgi:diketogulonate reductase-like aldo/keto reductase